MVRHYVTISRRSRSSDDWYEADAADSLARTVHEQESTPQPTGIRDANGNELFAIDEREPVGFVRFGA